MCTSRRAHISVMGALFIPPAVMYICKSHCLTNAHTLPDIYINSENGCIYAIAYLSHTLYYMYVWSARQQWRGCTRRRSYTCITVLIGIFSHNGRNFQAVYAKVSFKIGSVIRELFPRNLTYFMCRWCCVRRDNHRGHKRHLLRTVQQHDVDDGMGA